MSIRTVGVLVFFAAAAPVAAAAQTIVAPIKAGACTIVVQVPAPVTAGSELELRINKKVLPRVPTEGKTQVRIALTGPLREGDELSLRQVLPNSRTDDRFGTPTTVVKADGPAECTGRSSDEVISDGRETFEASGYIGMAVDNFAPASVGGYENSEAGGRQTRAVGGF